MPRLSLVHRIQARLARALLSLPEGVQRAIAGGRIEIDGHVLDAQVQHLLAMQRRLRLPRFHELPVAQARAQMDVQATMMSPETGPMEHVFDDMFEGPGGGRIAVRIYRPRGLPRPAPALVYFHGGGFVLGGLDSHDAVCRVLAAEAGCVAIAVDYRLAPEHPFPAAADDALSAFHQAVARAEALGIDRRRIAVGGDSAGGNLSAVVALDTRDEPVRPALQLLIYPATDLTMSFASVERLGRGFLLEKAQMAWFVRHYTPNEADRRHPRASPWFAPDVAGAPPAAVFTAGFDPLRDEGEAYARKLEAAGVPVTYRCHGGMCHGHINVSGGITHARPLLSEMAAALRRGLEEARV
ncbi:MAG TPA: alpha/beta hydrolase [Nannocystis sp.]